MGSLQDCGQMGEKAKKKSSSKREKK